MARKATITLDDFTGGMIRESQPSGTSESLRGRKDQYYIGEAIDLYREQYIGELCPGRDFTDLTDGSTRVNSLPLNCILQSDGEAFAVLENARVVQFGIGDEVIDAHNATAHSGHASLVGEDILPYKNATDEYVLYSFRDATDWDIGRRTKTGGGYVDTFMSGLATQQNDSGDSARTANLANPGKMWIGPDGIIYRTNGHYLMSHDPNTTVVNYAAINFGYGWVTTAGVPYGNYSAIVGYKGTTYLTSFSRSEVRLWLWDGFSPNPNFIYDIPDNYVSAIVNDNGVLKIFTYGRGDTMKIWAFVGGTFLLLWESPRPSTAPRQGSIEIERGRVLFCAENDSRIYSLVGKAIHRPHLASSAASATEIGTIKNLSTANLYIGHETSSAFKIAKRSTTATYSINAQFISRLLEVGYKMNILRIRLEFSQFGTGASLGVHLFENKDTLSLGGANDLMNVTITNATLGAVDEYAIDRYIHNISSFYLVLDWSHSVNTNTAAIVRRILIDVEESGLH